MYLTANTLISSLILFGKRGNCRTRNILMFKFDEKLNRTCFDLLKVVVKSN